MEVAAKAKPAAAPKKPAATEKQTAVKKPVTAKKPAAAKKPAVAKKPSAAKKLASAKKSAAGKRPAAKKLAAANKKSAKKAAPADAAESKAAPAKPSAAPAQPSAAKLKRAKAKEEIKEKKKALRKEKGPRDPSKPSKRALQKKANIHCRRIFIGNLPSDAREKDVMEMLKKHQSAIVSIKVLRSTGRGKKAEKNDKGKIIPRTRGAAFVRLRYKAVRDAILKQKEWTLGGKKLRVQLSHIKKKHQARLEAQAEAKKKVLAAKEEGIKKHKETMHKNLLKNKKHERNLHLKLRRMTSKKGTKTAIEKKRIVSLRQRIKTKKAKAIVRTERKKLYGVKARKAMVRLSRK